MDDERDPKEELDNAMIPFTENCVKVAEKGWNMSTLLELFKDDSNNVWREITVDFDGNCLSINTTLVEAPDGSLWRLEDE